MAESAPRRSKIARRPINYNQLNSGLPLPQDIKQRQKPKTWSTTKFYPLEIIDSKLIDEKLWVKVHYTEEEWSSPVYDEWRPATEVTDIPDCFTSYTEESKDYFLSKLRISIKEALHAQRKVDSLVKIEVDIQRDLFADLFPHSGQFTQKIHLEDLSDWDEHLGSKWNIRLVNCKGDHAFVTPGTLSFWMRVKKPLEDYNIDGTLSLLHRGYRFHMQFVRGLGNKFDLE